MVYMVNTLTNAKLKEIWKKENKSDNTIKSYLNSYNKMKHLNPFDVEQVNEYLMRKIKTPAWQCS